MSDQIELEKAAKSGDGCAMRDALANIPFDEHLRAIQDLQQKLGNGSGLDIKIAQGSTASHFDFSISSDGLSTAKLNELPQKLHVSSEQLRQIAQTARNGLPPMVLFHESYNFSTDSGSLNLNNKSDCHSKSR